MATEQEYFALLERIVKGAEFLENPLLRPEDHAKWMKLYDELCRQAQQMRRELDEAEQMACDGVPETWDLEGKIGPRPGGIYGRRRG